MIFSSGFKVYVGSDVALTLYLIRLKIIEVICFLHALS